mgnify:CR=1 FL=1
MDEKLYHASIILCLCGCLAIVAVALMAAR